MLLAEIVAGKVHIIVGTHAVLSAEFEYARLGLLVVDEDEEQKFGVHDKERLAMARASLDVLTLTATPLPRTLHMLYHFHARTPPDHIYHLYH
jgi:transcription-repair coupling factor (superfamily II helicase)